MKIYMDDERKEPEGWVRTRSVAKTIELLKTGEVTELSLDNDLGIYDSNPGYHVTDWLEYEVCCRNFIPPAIIIHTQNIKARDRMKAACRNMRKFHPNMKVSVIPGVNA